VISEVTADWHELTIPQHIMHTRTLARTDEQDKNNVALATHYIGRGHKNRLEKNTFVIYPEENRQL